MLKRQKKFVYISAKLRIAWVTHGQVTVSKADAVTLPVGPKMLDFDIHTPGQTQSRFRATKNSRLYKERSRQRGDIALTTHDIDFDRDPNFLMVASFTFNRKLLHSGLTRIVKLPFMVVFQLFSHKVTNSKPN